MEGEDVRIVRDVFDGVAAWDVDGVLGLLAPDVVWEPRAFLTGEGEFHGHDGVRRWMDQMRELAAAGTQVVTVADEYRVLGDGRILVLGEGEIRRPAGDLGQKLGWLWTLADGRVTEMHNYLTHDEALRAAGLEGAPES